MTSTTNDVNDLEEFPSRRDVLRYGAAGLATAGMIGTGVTQWPESEAAIEPVAADGVLDLYINAGFVPMVDGSLVYMRGFGERRTALDAPSPSLSISPRVFLASGRLAKSRAFPIGATHPHDGRPKPAGIDAKNGEGLHTVKRRHWASYFPRRTIVAETGSRIRLRVHNGLSQPHRFRIAGVKGADSGIIPPRGVARVAFNAPRAGTYIYSDPTHGLVERVLGLYGVLVVVPQRDRWRLTPGGAEFERQWLWICHDIDPEWADLAQAGRAINPKKTPLEPRYFTLNDRSGIFSVGLSNDHEINQAAHEETLPAGSARRTDVRDFSLRGNKKTVVTGQLLRLVNTGIAVHQLHFHGNHVWTLRLNGEMFSRHTGTVDKNGHVHLQQWEDVVELPPMARKEAMLPLKPPPDSLAVVRRNQNCDWHYPMHCHAEMSQTAAGGIYPGGMVADWILAKPLRRG